MNAEMIWLGWLALFLIYEITGAVTEKNSEKVMTLSRNVWDWFGVKQPRRLGWLRRSLLGAFMGTLSCHFVFGEPGASAIMITGAPVALVIAYAIIFERGDHE